MVVVWPVGTYDWAAGIAMHPLARLWERVLRSDQRDATSAPVLDT